MLEPAGTFESVEDLRRSVINLLGRTELLYLEDLTKIHRGYIDPPRTKMTSSGTPFLGLAISMREGCNMIDLGEKVMPLVARPQSMYPIGLEFDIVAFQPEVVDREISEFIGNVQQGRLPDAGGDPGDLCRADLLRTRQIPRRGLLRYRALGRYLPCIRKRSDRGLSTYLFARQYRCFFPHSLFLLRPSPA